MLFKKESTLDKIKKAYADLSDEDKEDFKQSIADRVDESVAAQKEDEGEKSEQSAEAEIHEALGEEHAEGKGETEELGEKDDTSKEEAEDKRDETAEKSSEVETSETEEKEDNSDAEKSEEKVPSQMDRIEAMLGELLGAIKKPESEDVEKHAAEVYGLGNSPIAETVSKDEPKKVTAREIAATIKKFMN